MRILSVVGWVGFISLALYNMKLFNVDLFDQPKLTLAKSFNRSAEACLLDVQDKNVSYVNSKNCNLLSSLSLGYIEVSGRKIDENSRPHFVYMEGLKTAWSAAALSNAKYGTKVIALW